MRSVDSEARLVMIKFGRLPTRCRVTLLTFAAEIRSLVIWIVGCCESRTMTREAVRRRIGVAAAVTVLTSQRGVSTR